MGHYIRYHPRHINGKPRNERIVMEDGELDAMGAVTCSRRNRDGLTRKERRMAYVKARKAIQDAERLGG